MGTSFNNQWVLRRARPRRGEPATVNHTPRTPADPPGEEGQPSDAHRGAEAHRLPAKAHAQVPAGVFDLAFARRSVRKHPRWIDRDT